MCVSTVGSFPVCSDKSLIFTVPLVTGISFKKGLEYVFKDRFYVRFTDSHGFQGYRWSET